MMAQEVQEEIQAIQETVIAKDQQSLFDGNIKEDQKTAAESATATKEELRQHSSVGNMLMMNREKCYDKTNEIEARMELHKKTIQQSHQYLNSSVLASSPENNGLRVYSVSLFDDFSDLLSVGISSN